MVVAGGVRLASSSVSLGLACGETGALIDLSRFNGRPHLSAPQGQNDREENRRMDPGIGCCVSSVFVERKMQSASSYY